MTSARPKGAHFFRVAVRKREATSRMHNPGSRMATTASGHIQVGRTKAARKPEPLKTISSQTHASRILFSDTTPMVYSRLASKSNRFSSTVSDS